MYWTNIVSLSLLVLFGFSYLFKLVSLRLTKKINAYALGKGKKPPKVRKVEFLVRLTSFLWVLVWISEIFFKKYLTQYFCYLIPCFYTKVFGLVLSFTGVLFFVLAMVHMKTSWRVGIDKQTHTSLVSSGVYRFSRNPAFLGCYLIAAGLFVTYQDVPTFIVLLMVIYTFHNLVLEEEKHLTETFGEEYKEYREKVYRYYGYRGRL